MDIGGQCLYRKVRLLIEIMQQVATFKWCRQDDQLLRLMYTYDLLQRIEGFIVNWLHYIKEQSIIKLNWTDQPAKDVTELAKDNLGTLSSHDLWSMIKSLHYQKSQLLNRKIGNFRVGMTHSIFEIYYRLLFSRLTTVANLINNLRS